MTSESQGTPGILKHLPLLEKILICILLVGIILFLTDINALVLRVGLIGLAVIFFVSAYRPPEEIKERSEDEPMGFSELLALTIVPKVLWISSAISLLGIAFYFLGFENKGYKQMLIIGMLPIGVCLILLSFFLISGVKHLKSITPILLIRAVPVLLAAFYFFFKQ